MHSNEWKDKLTGFIDLIKTDNAFAEQYGDLDQYMESNGEILKELIN